jgi:hypothetical protein
VKITQEDIETILEPGEGEEGPLLCETWYGRLGPLGFRLIKYNRTRQPVVGVVQVVGTRIRFDVKARSTGMALARMVNWVNGLNPDSLQEFIDFLRTGPVISEGRPALERIVSGD